jgi:hypothetical protein
MYLALVLGLNLLKYPEPIHHHPHHLIVVPPQMLCVDGYMCGIGLISLCLNGSCTCRCLCMYVCEPAWVYIRICMYPGICRCVLRYKGTYVAKCMYMCYRWVRTHSHGLDMYMDRWTHGCSMVGLG